MNDQRVGNPGTTNADAELPEGVALAPKAFSLCLSCHTVNGVTPYSVTGLEANANFGPDLTNLACRDTIAAGMLILNRENLSQWVDDPEAVKPGNYMADVVTPGLIRDSAGEEGFNELIDYLMSLKPADGCAGEKSADGTTATPVASPVAVTEDQN